LQELAITYSAHPNMIALWKRQLSEHASALFEKEGKDKASEDATRQKDELYTPRIDVPSRRGELDAYDQSLGWGQINC